MPVLRRMMSSTFSFVKVAGRRRPGMASKASRTCVEVTAAGTLHLLFVATHAGAGLGLGALGRVRDGVSVLPGDVLRDARGVHEVACLAERLTVSVGEVVGDDVARLVLATLRVRVDAGQADAAREDEFSAAGGARLRAITGLVAGLTGAGEGRVAARRGVLDA